MFDLRSRFSSRLSIWPEAATQMIQEEISKRVRSAEVQGSELHKQTFLCVR